MEGAVFPSQHSQYGWSKFGTPQDILTQLCFTTLVQMRSELCSDGKALQQFEHYSSTGVISILIQTHTYTHARAHTRTHAHTHTHTHTHLPHILIVNLPTPSIIS